MRASTGQSRLFFGEMLPGGSECDYDLKRPGWRRHKTGGNAGTTWKSCVGMAAEAVARTQAEAAMWLILAGEQDRSAEWVYRGLSRRGFGPIHYIRPRDLVNGARIVHHLDSSQASFSITMKDGRKLRSCEIRGVLNRLQCVPADSWCSAAGSTAAEHLQSSLFSCLYCLEAPVLPGPHCGDHLPGSRSKQQYLQLAYRAGLPVPAKLNGSAPNCSALVLFDRLFSDDLPEDLRTACVKLAELAETPLLQVEFERAAGGLVFSDVSLCPDLRPRGTPFLNALASIFQRLASRSAGAGGGGRT